MLIGALRRAGLVSLAEALAARVAARVAEVVGEVKVTPEYPEQKDWRNAPHPVSEQAWKREGREAVTDRNQLEEGKDGRAS